MAWALLIGTALLMIGSHALGVRGERNRLRKREEELDALERAAGSIAAEILIKSGDMHPKLILKIATAGSVAGRPFFEAMHFTAQNIDIQQWVEFFGSAGK